MSDDESDGMTVAAAAALAALSIVAALTWLYMFHRAGQGRLPW